MIDNGYTADGSFALLNESGLVSHLPINARDALHLSDAGVTSTDGTSISATPWQFVRVPHGARLDLPGTDFSDRGHAGRDDEEYCPANSHVPRLRSMRNGIGTLVSTVARPTVDGGRNP